MNASAQLRAALWVEWLKFRHARVVLVTTFFLVAGLPGMTALTILSLEGNNPLLAGKAMAIVGSGGWEGVFSAANAIVSAGGLLGFGVVTSWLFGREFIDGTVGGMFPAAVSRGAIACAKLLLLLLWSIAVAMVMALLLLATGIVLGTDAFDERALQLTAKFMMIAVLTSLLALPCAWAAILGRGYLPGIATAIATVIIAQMAVMAGVGAWFPFSAPGLWAASDSSMSGMAVQLLLVLPVALIAGVLAIRSWRGLRLS